MKINTETIVKHEKNQITYIYLDIPMFWPENRFSFTLPELKEIVQEMEKMELAND